MENQISLDGSLYQGGGQIIRSALALATILKKPFYIHSIRKNRPNPGINNQLRSILAPFMEKLPAVGSTQLHFKPMIPKLQKFSSNSASSITLMMQALVPIALFLKYQKSTLVEGGTDVSKSPPLQSYNQCFIEILDKMGIELKIQNIKKGYYPKGNGSIKYSVKLKQKSIKALNMVDFKPPNFVTITYYLTKNNLPETHVQLKKGIKKLMRQAYGQNHELDIQIKIEVVKGTKTGHYGIGMIMKSETTIWDCSMVGEVCDQEMILKRLRREIKNGGCLDEHNQDQFLLFMGLGEGKSRIRIGEKSDHTKSMLYVLQNFLPGIKINENDGIIQIQGINYLS